MKAKTKSFAFSKGNNAPIDLEPIAARKDKQNEMHRLYNISHYFALFATEKYGDAIKTTAILWEFNDSIFLCMQKGRNKSTRQIKQKTKRNSPFAGHHRHRDRLIFAAAHYLLPPTTSFFFPSLHWRSGTSTIPL